MATKAKTKKVPSKFVEKARELGLDDEESAARFERAFKKIAPPKKKDGKAGNPPARNPDSKD